MQDKPNNKPCLRPHKLATWWHVYICLPPPSGRLFNVALLPRLNMSAQPVLQQFLNRHVLEILIVFCILKPDFFRKRQFFFNVQVRTFSRFLTATLQMSNVNSAPHRMRTGKKLGRSKVPMTTYAVPTKIWMDGEENGRGVRGWLTSIWYLDGSPK